VQNPSFPYLNTRKYTYGKRALTRTTPQLHKQIRELKVCTQEWEKDSRDELKTKPVQLKWKGRKMSSFGVQLTWRRSCLVCSEERKKSFSSRKGERRWDIFGLGDRMKVVSSWKGVLGGNKWADLGPYGEALILIYGSIFW